jgi:F0F1-type ATP synthase membrane subunit b/b'
MRTIAEQFKYWQEALDDFQKNVEKDLDEIRRYKSEVQQMKIDLIDHLEKGRYIRDDQRVIISAPEIIIGNVDKSGMLCGSSSKIILRGTDISLDGVGAGTSGVGSIVCRASSIRQIAVDPGIDGQENVAKDISEIVSQARNITIRSEKQANDVFTSYGLAGNDGGITLSSDGQISLNATLPCDTLKEKLEQEETALTEQTNNLKTEVAQAKSEVSTLIKKIDKLFDQDIMNLDETLTRTNFMDIEELHKEIRNISSAIYSAMTGYFNTLSRLAETNRQLNSVKEQKEATGKIKSSFAENTTGTVISLQSENISITSIDGDGNLRTNQGAGIALGGKEISITSYGNDGALIKDSGIYIGSQDVEISTVNPKTSDKNTDLPAEGSVRVVSKKIQVEAVDYETKDDKTEEKSLTKEGSFTLRAEKINLNATDTEGKATGTIAANAKAVEVKAMDVDKEKRTDKELAAGSSLLLLAEKVYAGARDKKARSKSIQVASDKVGLFGDTTVELQQDGKAILQLSGGDAALSGNKTTLYGEMTSQGKTTFKSDVTAETVEMKNLKVNSSFKTPYTTEGISVPGAPSTAKLGTKLSEEELKSNNG